MFISLKLLQSMVNAMFTNIYNRVYKSAEVEYVFNRSKHIYDCGYFISDGPFMDVLHALLAFRFNTVKHSDPPKPKVKAFDVVDPQSPPQLAETLMSRFASSKFSVSGKFMFEESTRDPRQASFVAGKYRDKYVAAMKVKEQTSIGAFLSRIGSSVDTLTIRQQHMREPTDESFERVVSRVGYLEKSMKGLGVSVSKVDKRLGELQQFVTTINGKLA
jgi:hypothetical protein